MRAWRRALRASGARLAAGGGGARPRDPGAAAARPSATAAADAGHGGLSRTLTLTLTLTLALTLTLTLTLALTPPHPEPKPKPKPKLQPKLSTPNPEQAQLHEAEAADLGPRECDVAEGPDPLWKQALTLTLTVTVTVTLTVTLTLPLTLTLTLTLTVTRRSGRWWASPSTARSSTCCSTCPPSGPTARRNGCSRGGRSFNLELTLNDGSTFEVCPCGPAPRRGSEIRFCIFSTF